MLRVKFVEILQLIIAVENIDFWCSGECNCLIITSLPFGDKSPNYQIPQQSVIIAFTPSSAVIVELGVSLQHQFPNISRKPDCLISHLSIAFINHLIQYIMIVYQPYYEYGADSDDKLYYSGSFGKIYANREDAIKEAESEISNNINSINIPIDYKIIEHTVL